MNPLGEIRDAALGWIDMLAGRPQPGRRFNATGRGLAVAAGFYFAVVVLTITVLGAPAGAGQMLAGFAVNALPLAAVALVIVVTVRVLRLPVPANALLVPAVYALAFVLVVGLPLSLFFGNVLANAMMAAIAYLLYREARDIGRLGAGVAVAFAVFGIVALAALPIALYMLTMPAVPAG